MEIRPKTMVQYCIDVQYFLETLSTVPNSIGIESIAFSMGSWKKTKRKAVPNKLRKLGVNSVGESPTCYTYSGVLAGMTKKNMVKTMRSICTETDLEIDKVRVRRVTLGYKGASAVFNSVTKEIHPNPDDLRKKVKVLGMTSSEGNVAQLLAELTAKKYSCTFVPKTINQIICSEIK